MTSVLIDTHAHLQDPKIIDDFEGVMARAEAAGVGTVVVPGYDLPSSRAAVKLAQRRPGSVFAAVGIHPHEADRMGGEELEELATLARAERVVAIGELGLDFYRDWARPEAQLRLLNGQLELALQAGLPVSVHSRGAEDAIHEPLAVFARRARAAGIEHPGVMHCFGGTLEQALRYVELGFVVSIAGPVTYPKNDAARRLAAGLPARSLVIETDTPYLPPQGMRGKRNEPALIVDTARTVASCRGITLEELAELTSENARRLFRLPRPLEAGSR